MNLTVPSDRVNMTVTEVEGCGDGPGFLVCAVGPHSAIETVAELVCN